MNSYTQISSDKALSADVSAKRVALGPPVKTVKPGAAVQFSHAEPDPVAVGENGSVTLSISEGYPGGTLLIEARGGEGLSVFGAQATSRFDMTPAGPHSVRLDYQGEADGVYDLHVMASVSGEGIAPEARAYTLRVKVGDWEGAEAAKAAQKLTVTLEDGQTVTVLEAEETIDD